VLAYVRVQSVHSIGTTIYQSRLNHILSMTSLGGSATMNASPRVCLKVNPANIQYSRMAELSHRHTDYSRVHMVVGKNRGIVEFAIAVCRSLVHSFMVKRQKTVTWHPTIPHILLENVTNTRIESTWSNVKEGGPWW
jgi:hypothetical protein